MDPNHVIKNNTNKDNNGIWISSSGPKARVVMLIRVADPAEDCPNPTCIKNRICIRTLKKTDSDLTLKKTNPGATI